MPATAGASSGSATAFLGPPSPATSKERASTPLLPIRSLPTSPLQLPTSALLPRFGGGSGASHGPAGLQGLPPRPGSGSVTCSALGG